MDPFESKVDSQLAGLPPEYQQQIAQIMRQKMLAQLMMQQSQHGLSQPTQFTPGQYSYAVKQNPLASLVSGLGMFMGNKGAADADTQIGDINSQAASAAQQELARIMALPPEQRVSQGATAKFSQTRSYAENERKRLADAAKAQAPLLAERGDLAGATGALTSGMPNQNPQPPAAKEPTLITVDDPNNPGKKITAWREEDPKSGKVTYRNVQGQQINIDARAAGEEQKMALGETKSELKTWQDKADLAKDTINSSRLALEAINEGAKSGGGEGYKQAIRKLLQGFGVQMDATAPTEQLQMALGEAILANARKLAPVTGEDVKQLEKMLGSINTDPQALQKMLAYRSGNAMKTVQDFNKWYSVKAASLKDPLAQGYFAGGNIGREPINPPGNTQQALMSIAEMVKSGGNPSDFAVGGQQIPPDARFDLGRNRQSIVPAPIQAPIPQKPINQMTPDELEARKAQLLKELEALRGGK